MPLNHLRLIRLAVATGIVISTPGLDSEASNRAPIAEPAAFQRSARTPASSSNRRQAPEPSPSRNAGTDDDDDWKRGPRGFATFYARMLDGRRTASGSTFDNDAMVAAHPTYAFGTLVRVTNLANGRSVTVRIVDRGPARSARAKGIIIDLSRAAAERLGFIRNGRARVRLDYREPEETNDHDGDDDDDVVTATSGR